SARLELLVAGPSGRAREGAVARPLLVPTRVERPPEPPGVAARDPVLAPRASPRHRLGVRHGAVAHLPPRRRLCLLVAAVARPAAGAGAPRRSALRPRSVPAPAEHRSPARADLVSAARDAAGARASP